MTERGSWHSSRMLQNKFLERTPLELAQMRRRQLSKDHAILGDIHALREQRGILEDTELEGITDVFSFVKDTGDYLTHFEDTRRLLQTTAVGLLNIIR